MVIDRDSTQDSKKRNLVILLLVFASLFLFALIYSLLSSLGFSLHAQPDRQPTPEIHSPDRPDRPNRKIPKRVVVVDSMRLVAPQLL